MQIDLKKLLLKLVDWLLAVYYFCFQHIDLDLFGIVSVLCLLLMCVDCLVKTECSGAHISYSSTCFQIARHYYDFGFTYMDICEVVLNTK